LVGLGRALMRQPNVFIMDEPISHLDTRLRSRMRSYIKRLHIDLKYTMLYVTHDQEEAMALADRIAIMDQGSVVQIGTPQEIFHNPVNMYVAGFVGEPPMNFLNCRAESQNGSPHLTFHGDTVLNAAELAGITEPKRLPRDVVVGIRPFYLHAVHEQDEQHGIPVEVFVVEPMGDATVISVNANDTRMQIVADPDTAAQAGDTLWLAFEPSHILLFDQQTGKRL
jgi:ABC-type sugar transport system ATPase subunit